MEEKLDWKCQPVCVSMRPGLAEHLKRVAEELSISRSRLIVQAVEEKLQEVGRPAPASEET